VASSTAALDACVLINLCATDRFAEITATLDVRFVIARQASDEVIYLRPPAGCEQSPTPIDVAGLAEAGIVEIADLRSDELATFVAAAAHVDDGEATTLALAIHRGLCIATDDRAALRVIGAEHPHLGVVSTSQLLRRYCDRAGLSAAQAAACLAAIEGRACFVPPASDPEILWWQQTYGRQADA
jgi:predicted nucleic acid-binding protein